MFIKNILDKRELGPTGSTYPTRPGRRELFHRLSWPPSSSLPLLQTRTKLRQNTIFKLHIFESSPFLHQIHQKKIMLIISSSPSTFPYPSNNPQPTKNPNHLTPQTAKAEISSTKKKEMTPKRAKRFILLDISDTSTRDSALISMGGEFQGKLTFILYILEFFFSK
ncbi:unnamed protein product [Cuscuta epithymum]|uniref:Uncharacterized protein n=1 Tax=Cuscuta epithymum TaxID=186058 RepID=A0AAV0G099_9ASTE|nr:unnamed protein product [Cuscuta epithymum]CAH9141189.1 unnamed protein product [Cuscuta epithymum]